MSINTLIEFVKNGESANSCDFAFLDLVLSFLSGKESISVSESTHHATEINCNNQSLRALFIQFLKTVKIKLQRAECYTVNFERQVLRNNWPFSSAVY